MPKGKIEEIGNALESQDKKSIEYPSVVKTVNNKKKTVDIIMSTESKDRHGEVILLSAWGKRLGEFMRQPIMLDNHKSFSSDNVLGRYEDVRVEKGEGLFARANYLFEQEKKETPDTKHTVRWAWVLVTNGLGAFSVGFMPFAGVSGRELEQLPEGIISPSVREQDPEFVYTDVELVECSQVTVPSNRDALARSIEGYEQEGRATELAIAKGVFDQKILTLPKKTFLIGYNMDKPKDKMIIRCSVDVAGINESVLHSKAHGEPRVDESEISEHISFEIADDVSESEQIDAILAPKSVETPEVEANTLEGEQSPAEGSDFDDIAKMLKEAGTQEKKPSEMPMDEVIELVEKQYSPPELKEGDEISVVEKHFKNCLEVFGLN